MVVLYSCVYSPAADPAQQHVHISTNLKPILFYPAGFCQGKNKFLITTEASPPHGSVSRYFYLQALISIMQCCLQQQDVLDTLGFFFLLTYVLFTALCVLSPFARSLSKHYYYVNMTINIFPREKISCVSIINERNINFSKIERDWKKLNAQGQAHSNAYFYCITQSFQQTWYWMAVQTSIGHDHAVFSQLLLYGCFQDEMFSCATQFTYLNQVAIQKKVVMNEITG